MGFPLSEEGLAGRLSRLSRRTTPSASAERAGGGLLGSRGSVNDRKRSSALSALVVAVPGLRSQGRPASGEPLPFELFAPALAVVFSPDFGGGVGWAIACCSRAVATS